MSIGTCGLITAIGAGTLFVAGWVSGEAAHDLSMMCFFFGAGIFTAFAAVQE